MISPLLSNIYLDYLDTKWERHYAHLGKLVRFADDFEVISKTKKAIKRIKLDIKDVTSHGKSNFSMNQIIKVLNRKIVGWRNYYGISPPRVLLKLDSYIQKRIIYWYNKKHQRFKRQNYHRLRELLYASGLKRVTVF